MSEYLTITKDITTEVEVCIYEVLIGGHSVSFDTSVDYEGDISILVSLDEDIARDYLEENGYTVTKAEE